MIAGVVALGLVSALALPGTLVLTEDDLVRGSLTKAGTRLQALAARQAAAKAPARGGAAKPAAGAGGGARSGGPAEAAQRSVARVPAGGGAPAPVAPRYQYTWDYACPGARAGSVETPLCAAAVQACTSAAAPGPQIIVYQRQVSPATTGWSVRGLSCDPAAVPANTPAGAAPAPGAPPPPPPPPPRPVLTMGMVRQAFHDTPFATPRVHAQPEGNATLVRLPVYLELQWPEQGFEPDEIEGIDPGRMLGYDVRIRPALQSAVYDFGDGTRIGPTTDLGGPYPTGAIKHPYAKAGVFTSTITATYTADFSVNGGAWIPIDDTTTLTSVGQPITVKTAANQLIE